MAKRPDPRLAAIAKQAKARKEAAMARSLEIGKSHEATARANHRAATRGGGSLPVKAGTRGNWRRDTKGRFA